MDTVQNVPSANFMQKKIIPNDRPTYSDQDHKEKGTIFLDRKFEWHCYNNCNYILFRKLPWPGDSKETFRSFFYC